MKKQRIILIAAIIVVYIVCIAAFLTGGFGIYERHLLGRNDNDVKNHTTDENPGSKTNNNPTGGKEQGNNSSVTPTPTSSPTPTPMPSPTPTPSPTPSPTPTPNPFDGLKVKAVYYTGSSAGSDAKLDWIINMAKKTELNAVVIDIKDTWVNYKSEIPEVNQYNHSKGLFDPKYVLKKLHDNNIYVIARLVVFKDHILATKRTDWAVKSKSGDLFFEGGVAWTNPYNREVWEYNIKVAREAAELGFDEIQFDYIRFPAASSSQAYYGENPSPRPEAINGFLKMAADELQPLGVKVSADIFGIVIESDVDGKNIGQLLNTVGMDIDYICPMVYPSHYANSSRGGMGNGYGQEISGVLFTKPDFEPYRIVNLTLLNAKNKLAEIDGYKAGMRPYLQAFTASYLPDGYYQQYGAEQVRQQVQGLYDAGYEEWILWNPSNIYPEGAFLPD